MDLSQFSTPEIAVAMVITGVVVVFCALVGLWAIVALVGKAFTAKKQEVKPSQPAPPPPKAPAAPARPVMVVEDGIEEEVVAVITAAITAISGKDAAICSVKRVREGRSSWSQAGMMQNTHPF